MIESLLPVPTDDWGLDPVCSVTPGGTILRRGWQAETAKTCPWNDLSRMNGPLYLFRS